MKRIFIVGCPRSGTTVLQSLLTGHPAVASFPESHFFTVLFKRRNAIRMRLRLASKFSRRNLEDFLLKVDCEGIETQLPWYVLSIDQHTKAFVNTLDKIATKRRKLAWVEKTPDHVNFIEYIESNVEEPLFIHIVRNGLDVVASLYDVTQKYPEAWEGSWTIDRCLRKWITCVRNSHHHLHKNNHILVQYETLVDNSEFVIQSLSNFSNIDFSFAIPSDRKAAAENIILRSEPWKANSSQPIYKNKTSKFHHLFNTSQQQYILDKISEVEPKKTTQSRNETWPMST